MGVELEEVRIQSLEVKRVKVGDLVDPFIFL
jgi:hypothetical protein